VQWSGSSPPDPTEWDTITYTYDPAGRRIKKNVVGSYIVKYVYDGGHVIAEYDDSGLLRKYIYGARVDEPVCMIDVADNNKAYYYHFDGLGSVVALSNSNGDSCQSYQYSVYGQVAASDPNFLANPYMFTGRRFDIETGLYYYRARYYNPHIGRFLQTDPIGYGYGYCGNNPLGCVDPSGLATTKTTIPTDAIVDVVPDYPFQFVYRWLQEIGFYLDYPEWYLESVEVQGKNFELTFETHSWVTDYVVPSFTVGYAQTQKGYQSKGKYDEKVPFVYLPDRDGSRLGRLDNRTLNRIIEPTLEAIDFLAMIFKTLPPAYSSYLESMIMGSWDSWFITNPAEMFYYSGDTYRSDEINYIIGGYAANKFGWSKASGWAYVVFAKARPPQYHFPWEPEPWDTYHWFWVGYHGCF